MLRLLSLLGLLLIKQFVVAANRDVECGCIDSIKEESYEANKPLEAVLLTSGINWSVWAFDRYALKADYAMISAKTIGKNFSKGFVWDNDKLETNMFMHPYHGSLYFNAARSNGFNFWQSSLFALGGSAMWEYVMESEYPSTNDIIATPIGGMALGEVFYRTSDLFIDERTTGGERFIRELSVFLISPMRGITRIINGDAWHKRMSTGRSFNNTKFNVDFSLGFRMIDLKDIRSGANFGFSSELDLEYGDRFSVTTAIPYDYFSLQTRLNVQKSQPILGQLNITGRLINRRLVHDEKNTFNVGLFQHYDYYNTDTLNNKIPYRFSIPASLGGGALFQHLDTYGGAFDCYAHINGVILGAVKSDYYQVDARDYNISSGLNLKIGAQYKLKNELLRISLSHNYYKLFTWQGYNNDIEWDLIDAKTLNVQGDNSHSSLNVTDVELEAKVLKNIFMRVSVMNVLRNTDYKYLKDISSNSCECRFMLTYRF